MRYPLTFTPDDGTILVTCPDLPEVTSFGDDEADALAHARDAVVTALEGRIRAREAIPLPSTAAGPAVALPALVELKVALHNAMVAADVRKAELGRRLGWHPPQVDRLLELDHASKLDQIEEAFAALGRTISIDVHDAA